MPTAEEEPKAKKVCPRCGRKNKAENKHCKYCGWDLNLRVYPDA